MYRPYNPTRSVGKLTWSAHSNPSQASVVKRADGCIAGAGWLSEAHLAIHSCHVVVADLISVAGHSLRLHQTLLEDQCFPWLRDDGKQ
jgi:hypothetical protein